MRPADRPLAQLKRDAIKMNRHRASGSCLSVVFSENRRAFPDQALVTRLLLGAHPGAGSVIGCPRSLEGSTHAVRAGIRRRAAAGGGLSARWLVFGSLRPGRGVSDDERQEEEA